MNGLAFGQPHINVLKRFDSIGYLRIWLRPVSFGQVRPLHRRRPFYWQGKRQCCRREKAEQGQRNFAHYAEWPLRLFING